MNKLRPVLRIEDECLIHAADLPNDHEIPHIEMLPR